MTNKEIIKHIDDGANYYVGLFGEAVQKYASSDFTSILSYTPSSDIYPNPQNSNIKSIVL